jgi:CheY-like chemotaxis protein
MMHDGKVGPVSGEHKEYLGDILSSGRHLLQLINDVLDLAKVESGKVELRPEKVDLERLVTQVRDSLRTLLAQKRMKLRVKVDPALGEIVIDPAKFKQVLYNYISNALKFTPDEGVVTVRLLPEGSRFFRLEVEDSGIGIKPEDLGRLFIEFQQLDSSMAKKYPGTGLGLALTKRLVEAQGGQVGVRSTPGEGSIFSAVLPRSFHSPTTTPSATPGRSTVLVIEDEPKDREWLVQTLVGAGYSVETASTGAEALEKCRTKRFDAITLDLILPDMGGWALLREIRAERLNRGTPVITVTVEAGTQRTSSAFRIHEVLIKPAESTALLDSLSRAGLRPAAPKEGGNRG